ncbi:MAG: zeta toxin family protein [Burkholderiales bacterium]|jgi:predicted ABC-type ATPase|nr:zeta toxin family protein [Burkholderiales bacterium]MCA3159242.1 zeta toxin family protein [Burkholderiales bacterium]MCA3161041.1 zeta toxin family protein [Burkholderiales bacterium]MCA3162875.1 zeta toxin family protein [Burkholderiales bacterium]MCA3166176.1 zeta toxin family protein [Burkholderiales bacterium]
MTALVPRLRMFAGPNGSGKSTIKDILPPEWLGVYVNADEIERVIRTGGHLNLANFEVMADSAELQTFLQASTLLDKEGLLPQAQQLTLVDGNVGFGTVVINSYWASVLADFIRSKLLAAQVSFTLETVMSSPDKVELLHKAQQAGYRTYLYFVATEDPEINVARVQYRVETGGHPVAEDKIRSRYVRSLQLLSQAVSYADRAYIFDNSGSERVWIAEVTDGVGIEMKTDEMPAWFKTALWDKFEPEDPAS